MNYTLAFEEAESSKVQQLCLLNFTYSRAKNFINVRFTKENFYLISKIRQMESNNFIDYENVCIKIKIPFKNPAIS